MGLSRVSGSKARFSITVLKYCLAAVAAANNIELSLSIGSRSVLAWSCRSWYIPNTWILTSWIIYGVAGFSNCMMTKIVNRKTYPSPSRQTTNGGSGWLTLQSSNLSREINEPKATPTASVLLQVLASFLAFVHVIGGILTLASPNFIGFRDTLKIIGRLTISAIICRIIALSELSDVRNKIKAFARNKAVNV